MMDRDSNGGISRQELRLVFENVEEKDTEIWDKIFKEVDLDKNDLITFDEFINSMKHFS